MINQTIIFQVCGSARSEPCTPLSCERGELCLPEGTPACKKDEKCVGALPLSKRAHADVKDMKDRLDKITKKITDAAEKVHTNIYTNTHSYVLSYLCSKYRHCICTKAFILNI